MNANRPWFVPGQKPFFHWIFIMAKSGKIHALKPVLPAIARNHACNNLFKKISETAVLFTKGGVKGVILMSRDMQQRGAVLAG